MVAVKAGDIESLLRRPDTRAAVVLLYGPDGGLVSERARIFAERSVSDASDPFQLVRLDADEIAGDPLRLADEANTIGLFGGKRAIWVRAGSRNLAPAVTSILAAPPQDAIVVIEAGELQKSSPLRVLCERSPAALAVPCYADDARSLATLVDATLKDAGLGIAPEAKRLLLSLIGADRGATRGEIEKLVLYAHGRGEISVEDVEAVIGDVSALAFDAGVDAAYLGELADLDKAHSRLMAEGTDAGSFLGYALRHGLLLAQARIGVDRGASPAAAAEGMRSLHFKRKPLVERQLRLWTTPMLRTAIGDLGNAVAATRRQAALAPEITLKGLWGLALAARRAGRGRG
jgi:DNA polymerase-3 subunit delta